MLFYSLLLVLLLVLSILIIEDFKTREVSVWALGAYGIGLLLIILLSNPSVNSMSYTGNSFFSALMLILILFFYSRIRFKEKSFFNEIFGAGDVIFILCSSLIFRPIGFWLFIILSSVSAIISSLTLSKACGKDLESIPFIGYMGLVVCALISQLFPFLEINSYLAELIFNINS